MKKIFFLFLSSLAFQIYCDEGPVKNLNLTISEAEKILATEAVSIRQQATITNAMFSVMTKVDLGTLDSYQTFEELFAQIARFPLTMQKQIVELGNTQAVSGGALASLVAARKDLEIADNEDWIFFIKRIIPLINMIPFDADNHIQTIQVKVTNRAKELSNIINEFKTTQGLLTPEAKESVLSILYAYEHTLGTLSLMIKSVLEKINESESATTLSNLATFLAKFALMHGISYLLTPATAGLIDESTKNVAYLIGGELAREYVATGATIALQTAQENVAYQAISTVASVPLEAASKVATATIKESLYPTQEKQRAQQEKIANQILDNETVMSKMYAESTKAIADNIMFQLRAYADDAENGYAIDSSECTTAFQALFNALISLSNHVSEFTNGTRAAGIALLNIIKEREIQGHTNRERLMIFMRNVVPLFKQLPEQLGTQIEYATVVRFKNYEEQLAKAENLFVFTPTEKKANKLLDDDVLSSEAVNRLTTVIRSYRAAIFSVTRLLDQIKDALPGPRGGWWRALEYVSRSRLFTFATSLSLTFAYTYTAATIATPGDYSYWLLVLAIPILGNMVLDQVSSGAKWLISPTPQSQQLMIESAKQKEKIREALIKGNLKG